MIELAEWWDIEYETLPADDKRYSKKVKIIIKNHSPYIRQFKIGIEKIEVKNKINYLRIQMFLDISNPIILDIDRYKKKEIDIPIPKLVIPEKDAKVIIFVENINKKEKKTIEINI